ncbi:MAG TPA: hypothetical protein VMV03_03915 [Spirochaetia bacterium]|nr:hypothetical protein [Spirochaetia bacterium]
MTPHDDPQFNRALIDSVPFPLFVVNDEVRIIGFNRIGSTMLGDNPAFALTGKGGEALHCIHATEALGGCGASEACKTCVIRGSVGVSCREGKIVRRPQRMHLVGPGGAREVYLLITTSPVTDTAPPLALLILQEIGELVSTQGIVPVCMHCGKVRGTAEEQWASMEQYLKEHLDLDMSHGLCPECLKKHYPDVAGAGSP